MPRQLPHPPLLLRTLATPRRALLLLLAVAATLLTTTPPATAAPAPAPPPIRGGDTLHSDRGGTCAVGFNARKGSAPYAIVEGRCAYGTTDWYADRARTVHIAGTVESRFPGEDFAVLRYTSPDRSYPSEIELGGGQVLAITGAQWPTAGQALCRAGPATGTHCGTVRTTDVSVDYPEGTVHGLFQADLCADPGEPAGGPAFFGAGAIGLLAAGGDCSAGGDGFYQPVLPALEAFGLTIP